MGGNFFEGNYMQNTSQIFLNGFFLGPNSA